MIIHIISIIGCILFSWICLTDKWSSTGAKIFQVFILLVIVSAFGQLSTDLRQIDKTLQQIIAVKQV